MLERYSAGRTVASEADQRHLAVSSVEHVLDRDRDVVLVAQDFQVPLPAPEHYIATPIRGGSRQPRVLPIFDLGMPMGLSGLGQAPRERPTDELDVFLGHAATSILDVAPSPQRDRGGALPGFERRSQWLHPAYSDIPAASRASTPRRAQGGISDQRRRRSRSRSPTPAAPRLRGLRRALGRGMP